MIDVPGNLSQLPPATGAVHRALISVFDKTGIVALGQALHELGVKKKEKSGPPAFSRQQTARRAAT